MKTKSCSSLATLMVSLSTAAWIQAASTTQFSATSYAVAENAGSATLTVQRSGDTHTEVGVDYATADGTATNGLKYTAVSGTLAFGAGETNKVIAVPILNNGLVDGTKNFRVILSNPTGGGMLGTRTNVQVLITDNDGGIELFTDNDTVAEDSGAVVLGVVRGDDGNLPVTVGFITANLTATSGLDYTGITNTLSFAPHELLKWVTVPILNDSLKEANETFRVTLSNPVSVTLATPTPLTVTIVDNDQGFAFEFASYSVAEDAGLVRINVLRGTDDTNATVTVDFATTDLTATKGLDYTSITNTLSFAPGEKVKLVTVPILNDGVKESSKNFRVTLSNPTGGAVLGSRTTATVTIVDNDPGVGFELSSYSVWENAGAVTVAVLRGNDMALGPITVDYATSNLTAQAGQDYEAVSGTVAFLENETIKTIPIPILRNGSVTNDRSFKVTLSNPTGGATLGTASTTVNILDASGLTSRTVTPQFDTALTIRSGEGVNLITWTGGGQLQRADHPTGPWQTLTTATNPFTVQSPLPTTFYRVTRPRPVNVYIPSSYDGQTPLPLVIMLHGYTSSGANHEAYMRFSPLAQGRGFLYCYPDGTIDILGDRFWNATDACCDYYNSGVDDAGYLRALIEEIGSRFSVDRKRIYLIGHSNGGYMANRMACQSADLIAGIASLAGTTFLDPSRCQPSQPVNILQIHGTADVSYLADPFQPGALQSVQFWAGYNGAADPMANLVPSMNLDLAVPGLDTVITRYTNAPPGGAVELWTINGGGHVPTFYSGSSASEFAPRVIDWLLTHPKP
jgi:poly(3-hydroxybutyrate) depolymerase